MNHRTATLWTVILLAAATQALADGVVGRAISGAGNLNLTDYQNPWDPYSDTPGEAFSSFGDGFGIFTRPAGPFSILDDSVSIFAGDTMGFIAETDNDPFFAIVDLNNDDNVPANNNDASVIPSAVFTFDISAAAAPLKVSLDIAAMGDFEDGAVSTNFETTAGDLLARDFLKISYAIDGGTPVEALNTTVDPDGSRSYFMDNGVQVNFDDPISINGVELTEDFATFMFDVAGSGSSLDIIIEAWTDSGSEAMGLRNLEVAMAAALIPGDADGDGDVDGDDFNAWGGNFPTASGATLAQGDFDGDGDVDGDDFNVWGGNFPYPGPSAPAISEVPEPASFALIGLGLAFLLRRRRA